MKKTFPLILSVAALILGACAQENHPVNAYTPTGPGVADIAAPDQVAVDHIVAAKGGAATGGSGGGANGEAAAGGAGGGGHR
ncbi:MAG: hypothetical protein H0X40_10230 [Chthoniobacterales bacterium]|nr:hypothetical protein [Chthoniobacterales bacterium]